MIQFFKDSIRELKHVVWPTRKETSIYFSLVVVLLICFGIYLFIFSTLFSEFIFSLNSMFSPASQTPIIDSSNIDLGNIEIGTPTAEIVADTPTTEVAPVEIATPEAPAE